MYEFNYHQVSSVDAALELLAGNEDAKLLSGGMTLLPTMKQRLAQPSDLIDITRIEGLSVISPDGEKVRIGATARHVDVANHPWIQEKLPALSELAGHIGDAQVRNRGTLGGSIANADPAADYPAALLALAASIETNKRKLSADEFFLDIFETALD
ncbi:MAG: carbon monoxide dehydrogenase, partial [Thiotrichales bacterium]|nr:carbon monoxide dehydrogenase [Thiotrichales bacterium]